MSAIGYMNMALELIQRSNPLGEIAMRLQEMVGLLLNYNSNIKLNKYRQSLYVQQLQRMEGYITQGSPYQVSKGEKMDRKF